MLIISGDIDKPAHKIRAGSRVIMKEKIGPYYYHVIVTKIEYGSLSGAASLGYFDKGGVILKFSFIYYEVTSAQDSND